MCVPLILVYTICVPRGTIYIMKRQKIKIELIETNEGQILGVPSNPRFIKDEKFESLKKSAKEFPEMLEIRDIAVYPLNGRYIVLGGNMRFRACVDLGYKEVFCVVLPENMDVEKLKEFAIKDNSDGWYGQYDWDKIANEWNIEVLVDWGMTIPNFELPEETPEATEDNYEVPAEIKTNIVKGDLFEIGNHRLLCGDSTDSEQVAKLMNGEKAEIVVTDPPYGISLKYVGVMAHNTDGEIINDDKDFDPSFIFMAKAKVYYIFGADYFLEKLPNRKGLCIWAKAHSENENLVFGASFETFWRSHKDKREIWYEKRITHTNENLKLHASQKPTSLIKRCINDAGIEGGVLDFFLGSGTTMVAAHQLQRKCYGMELSEKYCQVIIERMLKLDPTLTVKRNGVVTNEFH